VNYKNSIACRDSMIVRGAPDVQALDINSSLGHGDCAPFAMLAANNFFGSFREDIIVLNLTVTDESSPGANDGAVVSGLSGGVPGFDYLWNTTSTSQNLNGIGAGIYTLTVTDTNGCNAIETVTVGTIGIEQQSNPPSIAIYPNPAKDMFNLELVNFTADVQLSITDLTGKVALYRTIPANTDQLIINVETLINGIYLVKLQSGNNNITRRVVINK
jgi:hypothetical protein